MIKFIILVFVITAILGVGLYFLSKRIMGDDEHKEEVKKLDRSIGDTDVTDEKKEEIQELVNPNQVEKRLKVSSMVFAVIFPLVWICGSMQIMSHSWPEDIGSNIWEVGAYRNNFV